MTLIKKTITQKGSPADFGKESSYSLSGESKPMKYGFLSLTINLPALPEGWIWRDDFMEEILRQAKMISRGFCRARIYGPINSILARQYQYGQTKTEPMWRYRLQTHQAKIKISRRANLVKLPLMFPNAYANPEDGKIPSNTNTDLEESISVEFAWLRDLVRKTSYQKPNFSDLASRSLGMGYALLNYYVDSECDPPPFPFSSGLSMKGAVEFTGTESILSSHNKFRLNFMGDDAISDYIVLRIRNEERTDPQAVVDKFKIQLNGQDKIVRSGKYTASPAVWKRHVGSPRPSSEWYLIPYYDLPEMVHANITLQCNFNDNEGESKSVPRLVDIYIH